MPAAPAAEPTTDAARPQGRVRVGGMRVRCRLLVLVVVPLLGILVLASSGTVALWKRAERASAVEQAAVELDRAAAAEREMWRETLTLQFTLTAVQGNAAARELTETMGMSPQRLVYEAARTDDALAAMGPDAATVDRQLLARVRDGSVSSTSDPSAVAGDMRVLLGQFGALTEDAMARLDAAAADQSGSGDLTAAVAAVRAVETVADAEGAQYLAGQALLRGEVPVRQGVHELTEAHGRLHLAFDQLSAVRVAPVAVAWIRTQQSQEAIGLHQSIEAITTGTWRDDLSDLPSPVLQTVARSAFEHQNDVYQLLTAATDNVRSEAHSLQDATHATLVTFLVLAGTVIAATLVLSVRSARSILRPLRRLAEHARAVGRGHLDADLGDLRVPADVAVTFHAMDDLVANLRLLEAKSQAIAAGDLAAPVLAEPLPGALGQALARSAETLSGSLVEQDRLRADLTYQSRHDALTGLRNRDGVIEDLEAALGRWATSDGDVPPVVVAVVNIDEFRRINDVHGSAVADEVLRIQAARVVDGAIGAVSVARLGADEFAVVHRFVGGPSVTAGHVRRLLDTLAEPVVVGDVTLTLSASAGVAIADDPAATADQLLARATLATGRAKATRGPAVELYDRDVEVELRRLVEVEEALHAAIAEDEGLFLVYQPVVDLATMRPTGVEALVRWDRPGHGIQPPDSFIPVAERSDLIIELDRWVIATAMDQLRTWSDDPSLRDLKVAVNVSGRHLLSGRLTGYVEALLAGTAVEATRLVIEITETVVLDDADAVACEVAALRRMGVRVSIDDFGTGYTSLGQLGRLPVDIIKIDRSFVQGLDDDRDRTVSGLIAQVAHQLGATTVAEGIETDEQLQAVRDLGWDKAQGYLLSRPLPVEALREWMVDAGRPELVVLP